MGFKKRLDETAQYTETRLSSIFAEKEHKAQKLDDAVAYSALGGGKRLRAYLVHEFCELLNNDCKKSTDYACAIEMIHAFSLVHDDLPAMDNDDMRRGKPSNHVAFGEATAILAGDSLALDAFFVAGENKFCSAEQNLQAVTLLSQKSGSLGMCAGQQFDLDGEGKTLNIDELTKLVDLKTGALFSCACMLGVIASNGNESQLNLAERFGRAFQITDDLLDIHSTSDELGKTIGKDIEQQKSTFVSLLGEDGARNYAKECIAYAKDCLDNFPKNEAYKRLYEFCDFILIRSK